MIKPFFSVIIPVYNRKELLLKALESVEAQTFRDFEIIVSDDGSTDGVEKLFPREGVRFLQNCHSGMPGAARNRGALAAQGRFLAFLDSDDIWHSEKLEKQYLYLKEHPGCRILHTREIWNRQGRIISQKKMKHKREGDVFTDALHKCIIGPSTVAIESKLYLETGGFKEDIEIAEDYEYWLRLTDRYSVGYIDEPLITKNAGHGDQLSEKYGQIEIFRIKALQTLLRTWDFSEEHRQEVIDTFQSKCEIYAQGCEKRGKTEEAEKYRELLKGVL